LNFGATIGTPPHLVGELFKVTTGADIYYIPYKSVEAVNWPSRASMGIGPTTCNRWQTFHWRSYAFIAIYAHGRDSPGTAGGWHG
jgi:hypothetical protein